MLPMMGAEKRQGSLGFAYTIHQAETGEIRQWLLVRAVLRNGAADEAGVREHDLIAAVNGKPVAFDDDVELLEFFATIHEGDRVKLKLLRGDRMRDVILTARPMSAEQRELWHRNYEVAKQAQEKRRKRG